MSGSLTVSARPCGDDIMRIASVLADVLHIDKSDLVGKDSTGVCAWLHDNMPNAGNDRGITQKPAQQRDLCAKLSLLVGKSGQQDEACGMVATKMCELASLVNAAFEKQYSKLEQSLSTCTDASVKAKLVVCKDDMSMVKSLIEKQREIVDSWARSTDGREAKTSAAWADKMTDALSGVPVLAKMIDLVCKASDACEIACAEAAEAAASGGGGGCGCDAPPLFTGGWIHGNVSGGSASGGLTIDTRIKKQTDERKKAMKEFRVKAEGLFDQVLRAVYALGQRMGKGSIVINDDLRRFVSGFEQLDNVYMPGIEYALTGFYVHATAVEQRERFLGKLQALISTLNPLAAGANGDVFREIKTPLEELQKHCDKYSDMFRASNPAIIQTRYGNPETSGGDWKEMAQNARNAVTATSGQFASVAHDVAAAKTALRNGLEEIKHAGGNDYDAFGGDRTLSKVGLTLKNVTKSLSHFFRIAKMRENLKKVSSESKEYSKNYDEVLGKPFALLIDKERTAFDKFKAELDGTMSPTYIFGGSKVPYAAAYGTIKKAVEAGSRGGDEISLEWNKEAITLMQLNSCNARIELYNVIQAIDLMLMNFTDSITANPDDVKEISKLLDSTEIVAEWFNETSGDYLAGVFEYMPWNMTADTAGNSLQTNLSLLGKNVDSSTFAIIDDKGSRLKKIDGHYYKEVEKIERAGTHPGNPFLMISPARAEYAREFARKTVERMLSLKNIVAAFSFMGNRARAGVSGGDSQWEPARIYAALCKYLYTSAFAMGWDGYDTTVSGNDVKSQKFGKLYDSGTGATVIPANMPSVNGYDSNLASINTRGIIMGVLPFDGSMPWHSILRPIGSKALSAYGTKKTDKVTVLDNLIAHASNIPAIANAVLNLNMQVGKSINDIKATGVLSVNILNLINTIKPVVDVQRIDGAQKSIIDAETEIDYPSKNAMLVTSVKEAQVIKLDVNELETELKAMQFPVTAVDRAAFQQKEDDLEIKKGEGEVKADEIKNIIIEICKGYQTQLEKNKIDLSNQIEYSAVVGKQMDKINKSNDDTALQKTIDDFQTTMSALIITETTKLNADELDKLTSSVVPVKELIAGGKMPGYESTNWLDYCNAIEQSSIPGSTRGWIIAFNPGDNAKSLKIVPPFARCAFGCAMNSVALKKGESGPFKTVGGWSGQFRDTDDLFMRALKAMVAKVVTVSGLYNMLNFASPDDHTMSSTRFIVGGSSDSTGGVDNPANSIGPAIVPQIHNDAVELYIRLPLLVEFYRDIYSLTGKRLGDETKEELIVALVPEMDLTWSSLMRMSFDSLGSGSVVTKNYAARMINEINMIYDKYKSRGSANLVSAVVNDFIADVNSRFGIMTRLESIKYKEMMQASRREYMDADRNSEDILTNFDTLGDSDFNERKASALPSDKFLKSSAGTTSGDQTEFSMGFIKALGDFRDVIDKKIRAATNVTNPDGTTSFSTTKSDFHEQARIVMNELKLLTTPEQRFNAIYAVMSGIDNVQKIDDNSHVMFHEVIIAPLAVLTAINSEVIAFIRRAIAIWKSLTDYPIDESDEVKVNTIFSELTKLVMKNVTGLTGMVDMNVSGSKVVVDHSKLQQFAEGLLGFVSTNIQKFRNNVRPEIIEKYELMIRNLQTELIENAFRSEGEDAFGLERASRLVTRMYGIFAKGKDVYGTGEKDEIKTITPPAAGFSFCSAMRKLAYYDPYEINDDFKDVKRVLTRDSRLEKLFMRKIDGKDVYMYEDLMFASRWEIYESKNTFDTSDTDKKDSMGLMMRFNELMARYLEQFWDESNRKIYTPLISGIAGNSDAAVHKAHGWPDLSLPKGSSSLPGITKQAEWASEIAIHFGGDISGTVSWGVTFSVPALENTDGKLDDANEAFINDLNSSSSAIAPTQVVNILKHAFDRVVAKNMDTAPRLEAYRNMIISVLGENWSKYGPIAAIAASTFALNPQGSAAAQPPQINTLTGILGKAKYEAPPIIPAPMSEFSGVLGGSIGTIGNPDEIMFASIAKVIRTMLTTQDKGIPLYTLPSLADSAATTPRMKENIRANLPIFTKMFGMLAESSKILGNILSTGINVSDKSIEKGDEISAQDGVSGRVFAPGRVGDKEFVGEDARNYLSRLLGKIANSCNVMVNTSAEVMKEVSDNPLFLETGENSIAAYRNVTNVTPFMPLSSMLAGLNDQLGPESSTTLYPVHNPGSRQFEFNYGTRFVLGQPKIAVLLDHTPGMREVVENYNKMVQSDRQITLENVSRMLGEYVQLARWVSDTNSYARVLLSMPTYKIPISAGASFQLSPNSSLDSTMDLTTNTDKPRMVAVLARWVAGTSDARADILDREKIQVWNLLDLNVNPVNINALRREVPLINVLNYAHTFDQFAKDSMALDDVSEGAPIRNVREMYLALAIDPYRRKFSIEWDTIFGCYGDASADLGFGGHSRFAQDQVFRKALLYSGEYARTRDRVRISSEPPQYGYAYPSHGNPGKNRDNLKPVTMKKDQEDYLNVLGRMRHDTSFIRNILAIDTMHRLLRVKLSGEMTRITFPVVTGPPAVSPHITDENVWETYDDVQRAYN